MSGLRWSEDDLKELQARQAAKLARPAPAPVGASTAPATLVAARAKRAVKNYPEEEIQKRAAAYLDLALPKDFRWWHTPNQRGTRKKWEVALLKALGVKPGVQDITIVGPSPRLVIIEIKSSEGSLSKSQRDWRDFYHAVGIPWFLCRSVEDVVDALTDCGIPLKARMS